MIETTECFRGEFDLIFIADCTVQDAPELDTIIVGGLAPTERLDRRKVTTHRRCACDVAQSFPILKVSHKRLLVQNGRAYTSIGLNAGLNLSLPMIQERYGVYLAAAVGCSR